MFKLKVYDKGLSSYTPETCSIRWVHTKKIGIRDFANLKMVSNLEFAKLGICKNKIAKPRISKIPPQFREFEICKIVNLKLVKIIKTNC